MRSVVWISRFCDDSFSVGGEHAGASNITDVWISYGNCNLFFITSNLFRWFICINSSESCPCSISAWKKIIQANMIVIQYIFSLLCVIVPLMTIYFLMSRPAMQREPVENDERAVLANRTIANGERRWASENISHSIQPSRNFPTEHDERSWRVEVIELINVLKSGWNRVHYCGLSYAGERGAELCFKA